MRTAIKSYATIQQYILDLPHKNSDPFISVINKKGDIQTYSAPHYFKQIRKLAKALIDAGIQRGDKVAILSNTRHEWSICDLAIIAVGGVTVPLYPNTTSEDLLYILNHSEATLIFIESKAHLRQQLLVKEQCDHLKHIILFDPPSQPEPGIWLSFNEFLSGSAKDHQIHDLNFEDLCHQAQTEELVTIIYTSGTTGTPKGVALSHQQVIAEITEAFSALHMSSQDHTFSFLPYSHVLGRTEHWGNLIVGYHMTYASGIERLAEELPRVEPTVIVGVPRVYEKIYTSLKAKIETSMIDSKIFDWAFKIGSEVSQKQQAGIPLSFKLKSELLLAQKLFFDRMKSELFGNKIKFVISGGAALSEEIIKFFHCCGILILEGYGLTETTGAICVNRSYDYEFGSVGKPLYKTKIKIASDGEILIQGPTTLKEYYKDPVSTQEQIQDHWLHTGDLGLLSPHGNLIITDRKKDLIKTANGKYVAPQKIESLFKQLPFISHVHIHGEQKNYVVALLTLNKNVIFSKAREKDISFKTMDDLKENSFIKDLIRSGVAQVNMSLASHESIKNYAILNDDFSIESGEITPSLKVKRKVIDQKYKSLIDSLY